MPIPTEPLLSVREVARNLGVSTPIVYRLCERGELVHIRVGSAIRIASVDIATYLGRRRP
jgi:excisionase family DNA binding protein